MNFTACIFWACIPSQLDAQWSRKHSNNSQIQRTFAYRDRMWNRRNPRTMMALEGRTMRIRLCWKDCRKHRDSSSRNDLMTVRTCHPNSHRLMPSLHHSPTHNNSLIKLRFHVPPDTKSMRHFGDVNPSQSARHSTEKNTINLPGMVLKKNKIKDNKIKRHKTQNKVFYANRQYTSASIIREHFT